MRPANLKSKDLFQKKGLTKAKACLIFVFSVFFGKLKTGKSDA